MAKSIPTSYQNPIAWQAEHRGDLDTAARWYEEEAQNAYLAGNVNIELLAMSNLAEMLLRSGKAQQALEVATRLLARSRKESSAAYEMRAIGRLVEALLLIDPRGRWNEIKPLLEDGLKTARQLSINYWELHFLIFLAQGYMSIGNIDYAFNYLQEAKNCTNPQVDDKYHLQAYILCSLSLVMLQKKHFSDATTYAEQAVGIAKDDGVLDFVAQSELILVQVYRTIGERSDAWKIVEAVCEQARKMKWKSIEQDAEYLRGELARELSYLDIARDASEKALSLADEMQAPERKVKSLKW